MPFQTHSALVCPIDGLPLNHAGSTLVCDNNHSFDIAKQGYANLLLSQHKRSRSPGDSREMVAARHRFLEAGFYRDIAKVVAQGLEDSVHPGSLIVDAGCGEGYYLACLKAHFASQNPALVGFDISKWALQVAAKRFAGTWFVASNRHIPLMDASTDVLLDMFGFPSFAEFARVLRPGGRLVRVTAGDEHLQALRELIYPDPREKPPAAATPSQFRVIDGTRLQFELPRLRPPAIAELFMMTPHYFRASASARGKVTDLPELDVAADVNVEILVRA